MYRLELTILSIICVRPCGLATKTEADKVIDIRGNKDDPLSRGHVCPKAVAVQDIHEDPGRVRFLPAFPGDRMSLTNFRICKQRLRQISHTMPD